MPARLRPYTLLDVFTDVALSGNPLAVVGDAGDLDADTMLAFARETRLSETTFVQPADAAGADYRNRIWTVDGELPFAGHPSLGTAVAVAHGRRERGAGGEAPIRERLRQQTGAGVQPIDVELAADSSAPASASMLQEPARHGPELGDQRTALCGAIGLDASGAHPALAPQVVSTGLPQMLMPLRDRAALARARPDHAAIDALLEPHGAIVLYAFAVDAEGKAPSADSAPVVHARAFAASAGIGEDPATGSAAGPLCAYLGARTGARRLTIVQGTEIGRPSRLETAIEHDRVRVGGSVVLLAEGTIRL